MERDRFGPVAIHSTPRKFRTSARKFWLNGLRPWSLSDLPFWYDVIHVLQNVFSSD